MLPHVLIETYWNVKTIYVSVLGSAGLSINRNILECKDEYLVGNAVEIGVLIETYWNVKSNLVADPSGADPY